MSRWKVYKDSENGKWQWVTWVATLARENWGEEPQVHRFPEWRMAMAYAAREAQQSSNTITIKDPSGELCDLTVKANDRYNDQHFIHLKADDDTFILAPHEWEPLARFLLAEANRTEEA